MNFVNNTIKSVATQIKKCESGQGTLEFASVAILLLTITLGIIDFSRAVYAKSTIQAASQEAARAFIVDHDATEAAKARIFGLDADQAVITVNNGADTVEVTVTYQFTFITPLAGSLLGDGNGTLELISVSSMVS